MFAFVVDFKHLWFLNGQFFTVWCKGNFAFRLILPYDFNVTTLTYSKFITKGNKNIIILLLIVRFCNIKFFFCYQHCTSLKIVLPTSTIKCCACLNTAVHVGWMFLMHKVDLTQIYCVQPNLVMHILSFFQMYLSVLLLFQKYFCILI